MTREVVERKRYWHASPGCMEVNKHRLVESSLVFFTDFMDFEYNIYTLHFEPASRQELK